MNELIQKKCMELAQKHAAIIEKECIKACEKFNVSPDELTLEYISNTEIKIKINANHFKIENQFICENGIIR